MDMARGLGGLSAGHDDIDDNDSAVHGARDAASAGITGDERRMQVRVYNHWAGMLGARRFPEIAELEVDLNADLKEDFGPFSVILDLSKGIETPGIRFVGHKLAEECEMGADIAMLGDVPARSLLSRITDHYLQILANEAPIGFEAEFVNQREQTILYRGILLPYSADGEAIDHIHGVINWKAMEVAADLVAEPATPLLSTKAPVLSLDAADHSPDPAFGLEPLELTDLADTLDAMAEPDGLYDLLAAARELALEVQDFDTRSRRALYAALGRAYDFALAAEREAEDFAELLSDAGLKRQARAPMTPVAKLVFGVDYDKTRLSEYAIALSHAARLQLDAGAFLPFLEQAEGGIKGVVAAERKARRGDTQAKVKAKGLDAQLVSELGQIAPRQLEAISPQGEEFALVMVRRTAGGRVVVLDEVPADEAMVAKAARKLVKARKARPGLRTAA